MVHASLAALMITYVILYSLAQLAKVLSLMEHLIVGLLCTARLQAATNVCVCWHHRSLQTFPGVFHPFMLVFCFVARQHQHPFVHLHFVLGFSFWLFCFSVLFCLCVHVAPAGAPA